MVTKVTKYIGPVGSMPVGYVEADRFAALNAFDNWVSTQDLVAQDIWVDAVVCANQADADVSNCTMNPISCDSLHYVVLRPADGMSVRELENNATGPLGYGTVGIELTFRCTSRRLQVGNGVFMQDFRINLVDDGTITNGEVYGIWVGPQSDDSQPVQATQVGGLFRNRIKHNAQGSTNGAVRNSSAGGSNAIADNVFFHSAGAGCSVRNSTIAGPVERNTFIRTGTATGAAVRNGLSATPIIRNNAFIGFDATPINIGSGGFTNVTSNYSDVATSQSGVTYGNPLVVSTTDVRPSSGSLLIGGANSSAVSTLDVRLNNRGATPDAGAVQLTPAATLPTGTITNISVSGQTVTVSGTTTNSPSTVKVKLNVTAAAYNSGVAIPDTNATLGTNTFTITFNNVSVGEYVAVATVTNTGGSTTATNNQPNINVVGATGAITAQSITGATLSVSGTTSGAPTSGTIIIPAAATSPNGAVTQGPLPLTLGTNTFSFSGDLPPGNYDIPVVRLTTAAGTSFPLSGGSAVQVIAIGGNPEAPYTPPSDTTAPTMAGTLAFSSVTTSGYMVSWSAATDNVGVTGYEVSTNGGVSYFDNGNTLSYTAVAVPANTTYSVYVRAYDAAGLKSTPLTGTVTTLSTVDTTPPTFNDVLVVSAITTTGFTLSWTPATDAVGVTGYEYSLNGGSTYTDVGLITSKSFSGLTPSTTYAARVRAYDAAGNRSTAISASATTSSPAPVVTVPDAPTGVVASAGIGSVTVSFLAPVSNGGATITSYTVTASTGQVQSGNGSPITIQMTAGIAATFTVHATNSAGDGPESTPSNSATALDVPDITVPQMQGVLSVTNPTATSATVAWVAATDDRGVTGYGYSVNGSAFTNVTASPVTITGLQPDTVYTIAVCAYDAAGNTSAPLTIQFATQAGSSAQTGHIQIPLLHPRAVYVAVSGFSKKRGSGFTSYSKPRAMQDPDASLDYVFDWTDYLTTTGSTITKNEYFVSNAEMGAIDFNTKQTIAWVKNGTVGKVGLLTNRITTNDGRVDERTIQIKFKEQ